MTNQLIKHIYTLASDPAGFESFLEQLLDAYVDVLHVGQADSDGELKGRFAESLEDVETHVTHVANIFDRFDWSGYEDEGSEEPDTAATPNGFRTDKANTITGVYGAKCRSCGISEGRKLDDLPIEWDVLDRFRNWLRRDSDRLRGNHVFLLPVRGSNQYPPMLFSATKDYSGDRLTGVSFENLDMIWDPAAGAAIAEVFHLTEAETEILSALVSGQTLNEIAQARQRSIQTVRTQAAALLRKTASRSQLDLVRVFSAIAAHVKDRTVSVAAEDTQFNQRADFIENDDGGRIQIDLYGPEDGLPVVMIHGLVSGTTFTEEVLAALYRENIRIIAPFRPSYGGTSPVSCKFEDYPALVARQVERVMNHYGIERAVLLGRFSGGLLAVAAANALGERVAGVVTVSGTPPYRSLRMFEDIQPMVRVVAYSARYFPAAIPVLTRGLYFKVLHSGEKRYFKDWYRAPETDAQCVNSDELRSVLIRNWHASFAKTTDGYSIDARYTALDWSKWLDEMKQPLHLVHGTDDPTTIIEHMRELAADYPKISLEEVDGGGQLLFHSHTDQVVRALSHFANSNLGAPAKVTKTRPA